MSWPRIWLQWRSFLRLFTNFNAFRNHIQFIDIAEFDVFVHNFELMNGEVVPWFRTIYQLVYSKYMQTMQINLDNWRFHNRLKTSVVKRNSFHFRTVLCEYVCVRPSVKIFLLSKLFQKYVMYFQIWGKFAKFISFVFFEKTTLNSFYFFSKMCVGI